MSIDNAKPSEWDHANAAHLALRSALAGDDDDLRAFMHLCVDRGSWALLRQACTEAEVRNRGM